MTADSRIGASHVEKALEGEVKPDENALFGTDDLRQAKAEFERQFILRKLAANNWNVTRTAEAMGIERTHLHRKIKALDIDLEKNGQG